VIMMQEDNSVRLLRSRVNKTGYPFQIAIAQSIIQSADRHQWALTATEFPVGKDYIDIVLQRDNLIACIECKRVLDGAWTFVINEDNRLNVAECRLEWLNGRLPRMGMLGKPNPRTFCANFSMCLGSPESMFCILPREKATYSLEQIASDLVAISSNLLDEPDLYFAGDFQVAVPVVVTNAPLYVCKYGPTERHLLSGELADGEGEFRSVPYVRFRKSLVQYPGNVYERGQVQLAEWQADRERTVFVVQASSLVEFLGGFRAFSYIGSTQFPPEYEYPARVYEGKKVR
jgi:hypothetical protein